MGNQVLRSALLVQMLLYMNAYSSTFMLSLFMQVSLGRTASTSGQVLAIGTVLMAVTAPFAGRLADRLPPRHISTLGVTCVLVGSLMALSFDRGSHLLLVTAMLAIEGVGFALFSSPNMTIIMNSVEPGAASMASALSAKARSLGMVSGMLVTAILISLGIGNEPVAQHPDRFVEIMTTAYAILVGVATCALIASGLSMHHRAGATGTTEAQP
jgi:MFS family permease